MRLKVSNISVMWLYSKRVLYFNKTMEETKNAGFHNIFNFYFFGCANSIYNSNIVMMNITYFMAVIGVFALSWADKGAAAQHVLWKLNDHHLFQRKLSSFLCVTWRSGVTHSEMEPGDLHHSNNGWFTFFSTIRLAEDVIFCFYLSFLEERTVCHRHHGIPVWKLCDRKQI